MLINHPNEKDFDKLKINEFLKKQKKGFFLPNFNELLKNKNINNSQKEIISLLNKIFSFTFSIGKLPIYGYGIDQEKTNFLKIVELDGTEIFSKMDLDFLESIVEKVQDSELKARISDILFIKNKHRKYAKMAIKCFMKSGYEFLQISSEVGDINSFLSRISRAIAIAISTKQYQLLIAGCLTKTLEKTALSPNNDYLIESLLSLLNQVKKYDTCLNFIDSNLGKIIDCHSKDRILSIAILAAHKLHKPEKVNDFYRRKAQNFFEEASRFASEGESYIGANHWLKESLSNLKKINSKSTADIELEKAWEILLTEFNKKMEQGLKVVSVDFDESFLIKENQKKLEEIKKYQSDILTTLRLFIKDYVFGYEDCLSQDAEISIVDCVSKISLGNGAKEVPNSSNLEKDKAIKKLSWLWSLSSIGIEELRKHIIQNFKKEDLDQVIIFFIKGNPVVPQKKLQQIFTAIQFGFFGDWVTSSHIIPAQIESVLRVRLENAGIYSLKTDNKNLTQQDNLLGTILNNAAYREYLDNDDFLGKNFMFNIESLLNHKHGANLRNEIYHGLFDDDNFISPPNIYLWWIFLKIIIDAKIKELNKSP
ncbi:MAG: hypothetical protein ACJAZX_001653 [Rickettsiales bacterium]|jgi:hypothetical protein